MRRCVAGCASTTPAAPGSRFLPPRTTGNPPTSRPATDLSRGWLRQSRHDPRPGLLQRPASPTSATSSGCGATGSATPSPSPAARLDYSAQAERALIRTGPRLPAAGLVVGHWSVYAVRRAGAAGAQPRRWAGAAGLARRAVVHRQGRAAGSLHRARALHALLGGSRGPPACARPATGPRLLAPRAGTVNVSIHPHAGEDHPGAQPAAAGAAEG